MQEISKELREVLGAPPADGAEIKFARDSLALALPGNNETADEVAGSYVDILTYRPAGHLLERLRGRVNALTPAQLQAAAAKLVRPDALTWVIVGDLAKIEDSVRKLNIGEVKVLDADGKVLR